MIIILHLQAKGHTHTTKTIPRLTKEGQQVGGGPTPGNSLTLPQKSWNAFPTC